MPLVPAVLSVNPVPDSATSFQAYVDNGLGQPDLQYVGERILIFLDMSAGGGIQDSLFFSGPQSAEIEGDGYARFTGMSVDGAYGIDIPLKAILALQGSWVPRLADSFADADDTLWGDHAPTGSPTAFDWDIDEHEGTEFPPTNTIQNNRLGIEEGEGSINLEETDTGTAFRMSVDVTEPGVPGVIPFGFDVNPRDNPDSFDSEDHATVVFVSQDPGQARGAGVTLYSDASGYFVEMFDGRLANFVQGVTRNLAVWYMEGYVAMEDDGEFIAGLYTDEPLAPSPVMTLLSRDEFTGVPAFPTSGPAEFTATDNENRYFRVDSIAGAVPAVGDKAEYTLTFPEGTLTMRARWTSSTILVIERVSTIPGTNNGTAILRTFTGASVNKPNLVDGSPVRMGIKVDRGAANNQTTVTMVWHGRNSTVLLEQTSDSFVLDGELTPTAGAYALTGACWKARSHIAGRTPDGGGSGGLATGSYIQSMGVDHDRLHPGELVQILTNGFAIPSFGTFGDTVYSLSRTIADNQISRLRCSLDPTQLGTFILSARLTGSWEGVDPLNGYMLFGFSNSDGSVSLWLYKWVGGTAFFQEEADRNTADNTDHTYELRCVDDQIIVRVDGVEIYRITDSEFTTGLPGFGGYRSTTANAGVLFGRYEVDGEVTAGPRVLRLLWQPFGVGATAYIDNFALEEYSEVPEPEPEEEECFAVVTADLSDPAPASLACAVAPAPSFVALSATTPNVAIRSSSLPSFNCVVESVRIVPNDECIPHGTLVIEEPTAPWEVGDGQLIGSVLIGS